MTVTLDQSEMLAHLGKHGLRALPSVVEIPDSCVEEQMGLLKRQHPDMTDGELHKIMVAHYIWTRFPHLRATRPDASKGPSDPGLAEKNPVVSELRDLQLAVSEGAERVKLETDRLYGKAFASVQVLSQTHKDLLRDTQRQISKDALEGTGRIQSALLNGSERLHRNLGEFKAVFVQASEKHQMSLDAMREELANTSKAISESWSWSRKWAIRFAIAVLVLLAGLIGAVLAKAQSQTSGEYGNANGSWAKIPISAATVNINTSSASTIQLVAASTGKAIYVTHYDVVAAAADSVSLVYGTQATNPCDTGQVILHGPIPIGANGGISAGNGVGAVYVVPAGNSLCLVNGGSIQIGGALSYSQF